MKLRRIGWIALTLFLSVGIVAAIAAIYYRHVQDRRSGEAQRLLDKADELAWNNQWILAEPLYKQAETLFAEQGDSSRALYAHVSQIIPHAESGSLPGVIFELTQDLAKPAAQDPETRLRILTIRGMIEVNYDAGMARSTWADVATLAKQQGRFLLASRATGEQGIAAFILGDISTAKRQVIAAWEVAKLFHDDAAHVRYASVYGAGLDELHRYQEALISLDDAINTARKNPAVAYPSIAITYKIDALRGLHRTQEALALANTAIARIPNPTLIAHYYQLFTARGHVYEDMGNLSSATADYALAMKDATQLDYWRGITEVGGYLARTYEQEGQIKEALDAIDKAIDANKQIPDELYFVPRNLAIKAEIKQKLGQREEADALYQKSSVLIDAMLAHVPTSNVERILLDELSEVYSGHFASLAQQKNYAGALQVLEEARGRVEAQALLHHDSVQPHLPSKDEQRLSALNLSLIDTDDAQKRAHLMQQIYATELNIDTDSLEGITATRPISLAALQRTLNDDELLVEYVLSTPHSFALAITRSGVHVYSLADRRDIETDATTYRTELRNQQSDDPLAARLYDALLSPIRELQASPKLILVPDGELHLLPFDALRHDGRYLLATHIISVAPSSTVLGILTARRARAQQLPLPYVGVAAWIKAKRTKNPILRGITGPERDQFIALPESEREVETIASDLPHPATLLLGSDATETHFKNLPLANYNVLHLALHGYVDNDYPDRSALVFAPEPNGPDDGLLQVREIRNLHLNASLVTLSACNTGVGPVSETGVANLVNAFIEAGADSVVSTLWELEDHSSELMMTDFYHHLSEQEHKADALRQAQLDLLAKHLPPYYWASFELVGEPNGTINDTDKEGTDNR
jgi:CHAT domain-containing protein